MKDYFEVMVISLEKECLVVYVKKEGVLYYFVNFIWKIMLFKDIVLVYKLYWYFLKVKLVIVYMYIFKVGIVGMMVVYFVKVLNRFYIVVGFFLMEFKGFKRSLLGFIEKLIYWFVIKVYFNL